MSISTEGLDLRLPEYKSVFRNLVEGHDRYEMPGPICRVTGGQGGEAMLIVGSERTALIDCGMAYCADVTVENTRKVLDHLGRSLDYILLSHSHYDHMGALPYFRKAFPNVCVMGSEHCAHVLERDNAKKLIKKLGETARESYEPDKGIDILTEGLSVDRILQDGERIQIGRLDGEDFTIDAIYTPGHTDCSISFYLLPLQLLFTSESTGIPEGTDYLHTPSLKSFIRSLDSVEKCRRTQARHLCIPHYGMLPDSYVDRYWDMFCEECASKTSFALDMRDRGLDRDEMLREYIDRYWDPAKEAEQPKEAFDLNSGYILDSLLSELDLLKDRFGL